MTHELIKDMISDSITCLYDGDAEDVATEADGDGADGHGGRAEGELEDQAQARKARPARKDLLLLRHEQSCNREKTTHALRKVRYVSKRTLE